MYLTLLILHFIGLSLGLGTSFAMFTLGLAARDLEGPERGKFMLRASLIAKNGSYGLLLLIVSGLGMMFLRGFGNTFALGGPPFHTKLLLVVVLCAVVGLIQVSLKKARGGDTAALSRLPNLGRIGMLTSVTIVVLAVIAFK
jgi:uncharacterized membrane protein